MTARVYLVDASPYIFRAFFSLPSTIVDAAGRPAGAVYGFTDFLLRLLREYEPTHLEVAFDFHLSRSFRNREYPQYKAQREAPPVDLEAQVPRCIDVARMLGAHTHIVEDYEADDIVGTLCHQLAGTPSHRTCVSSDKDLSQLVGPGVSLLDFAKGVLYGPEEVEAKFGVRPDQIVDYLGLAGDSVDNIPGVRGVGPKTAAVLLRAFAELEEIYADLDRVATLDMRGAAGVAKRLAEHRTTRFCRGGWPRSRSRLRSRETLGSLALRPPLEKDLHGLLADLESVGLAERVEAFLASRTG